MKSDLLCEEVNLQPTKQIKIDRECYNKKILFDNFTRQGKHTLRTFTSGRDIEHFF